MMESIGTVQLVSNLLLLELDDWVGQQVAKVQSFGLQLKFGMLLSQQPSDVTEEKASLRVMWVGVSV